MTQGQIDKTKKIVIPTFMILLAVGVIEAMITSNEFGLSDLILSKLLIPIIVLSILMSGYWILLTEDFWDLYERASTESWTFIKTGLKFLIWIPGMGLYFFAVTQGLLSIYNRTAGQQKPALITGQIIDKDKYKSSGTTRYYFEIDDSTLGRRVEIRVDESEYDKFNTGDKYQTERKIGALGLLYEARY